MSQNDDLTRTLTRELEQRSHAMDGTPLHLADVQGRARSIRRRRTTTAVAGVAAAVALIVPAVSLATHTSGKPEPAPAITQTPSPTQTATDDGQQPAAGVLDVSDLPTGAEPRVEYLTDGQVLHEADGSTVNVDTRYPVVSFTVLSDGTHLWLTADGDTPYVEVQDAEGNVSAPVRSGTWDVGVNNANTVGAWVRPDGQVMVRNSSATEPLEYGDPIRATDDMRMGPVLGDHCGAAGDSCEVYVNVSDPKADPSWRPWLVDVNGTQPYLDGTYLILSDVSESGLSIGYRSITDFGSCSILLGGGEFQGFQTCKHALVSFSPDSRLILADPAYHDGIGNGEIAMYDVGGKLLWDRHGTAKAQAFYPTAEWEDAEHALAPVFQDGEWSIVRFASDGSMEYAVTPIPGQDVDHPFVVATGGPVLAD
ncbi:MAG TPA: hypothetical protein VH228_00140 [Nocardioides sp.]|jgi:hypothetical protein|nr:hypothetical protein [Nocardioides sp.]